MSLGAHSIVSRAADHLTELAAMEGRGVSEEKEVSIGECASQKNRHGSTSRVSCSSSSSSSSSLSLILRVLDFR
jgi:hypothetical protein